MAEIDVVHRPESGDEENEEEEVKEMKPWEQHSAVISIPRFDYKAPISLLHRSFSGFLITCPIKREKSATKEAMSILEKFIGSFRSCNSEILEGSDAKIDGKRRKICLGDTSDKSVNKVETKSPALSSTVTAGALSEGSFLSSTESDASVGREDELSLVKLSRSGLLLFTFSKDHSHDVVLTVSNIIQSLDSGSLSLPLWCHRIFPIQATCTLNEKELSTVVSKLVIRFVNDQGDKLVRPVKLDIIEEELRRLR